MHIVKSFGVMSVAKIMDVLYACMGLVFAPFFVLFGLLGLMAGQGNSPFAGIVGVFVAIPAVFLRSSRIYWRGDWGAAVQPCFEVGGWIRSRGGAAVNDSGGTLPDDSSRHSQRLIWRSYLTGGLT